MYRSVSRGRRRSPSGGEGIFLAPPARSRRVLFLRLGFINGGPTLYSRSRGESYMRNSRSEEKKLRNTCRFGGWNTTYSMEYVDWSGIRA